VNGKRLVKKLDVFSAAAGRLKAVDRTVQAKAQDGALLIEFQPVKGQAVVCAISIAPAG
jgi:beta-galactosidase